MSFFPHPVRYGITKAIRGYWKTCNSLGSWLQFLVNFMSLREVFSSKTLDCLDNKIHLFYLLTCNSEEHCPARDWSSSVCSTAHILPSIRTIHRCRKVKGAITQNVAVRHIADCLSIHCPRYYGWWDTQNLTLHYGWQMFWHNHVSWVNTKMGLILRSCQKKNTDLLNITQQRSQNQGLTESYLTMQAVT